MTQHIDDTYPRLKTLRVRGFRSIRDATIELRALNVLIGANGAGKSNLLKALQLLGETRNESLARYVSARGGAGRLLHYGAKTSPRMVIEAGFEGPASSGGYTVHYSANDIDGLTIDEERAEFQAVGATRDGLILTGPATESGLRRHETPFGGSIARSVGHLLDQLGYFHFHDTTSGSPLRKSSEGADSRFLRPDGRNLATMLHRFREGMTANDLAAWTLISSLVRRVAPYIKSLDPIPANQDEPAASTIRLAWVDERDHTFDVSALSDGTLRAIALITALAQPRSCKPLLVAIDEPELGLHPVALSLVCALMRSTSAHHHVIVATQNPSLLDQFQPEDVVVAERDAGATTFRRVKNEALSQWLDDYSLSELLEKNVLGGGP